MLDSIYALLFVTALIIWILSMYQKSIIFNFVSLITWIVLMANSLYIEVPYHITITNSTSIVSATTGAHIYNEIGLSALCLAFIFINLLTLFLLYLDLKETHLYE